MPQPIQLTIPERCHEEWDAMSPTEQGRFCNSCQKQVVDFSNMSDRQIAEFFKKPSTGSICGRFMNDQLDRDLSIPKKRIHWVKYFFQITLPAFLLLKAGQAKAQGVIVRDFKKTKTTCTGDTTAPVSEKPRQIINGIITDNEQKPVSFVSIRYAYGGTRTNSKGEFSLQTYEGDVLTISDDIIAKKVLVLNSDSLHITFQGYKPPEGVKRRLTTTLGMVYTPKMLKKGKKLSPKVEQTAIGQTKMPSEQVIPSKSPTKEDINTLKLFPNPVSPSNDVSIRVDELTAGKYQLQCMDAASVVVFEKQIDVDAVMKTISVKIPTVAPGTYFVVLSNNETGKKYNSKLVIY